MYFFIHASHFGYPTFLLFIFNQKNFFSSNFCEYDLHLGIQVFSPFSLYKTIQKYKLFVFISLGNEKVYLGNIFALISDKNVPRKSLTLKKIQSFLHIEYTEALILIYFCLHLYRAPP